MNLFDKLKCKTMLSPKPRPPPVLAILATLELRTCEVPSVEELLSKQCPHFPFNKTFEEAFSEPLFVVHTSGSTGFPKPLVYTHDTGARNMKMISLDPPSGFDSINRMYEGKRVFMTFPPFHGASIVSHLFNAIPFGTILIAPTSGNIPSAKGLVESLKRTPADIAFIVPSIVQELSQDAELLDHCSKNLEMIIYCGGDLPQLIGDIVASKIRLVNQFGASELGLSALIWPKGKWDSKDWKYVQFHHDIGVEFHPIINDTYELCIVSDLKRKEQQPTFTLFPDQQEYASRDLFVRHPQEDRPGFWKWHARADDIIVFLNGEKTNPISMEQYIVSRNLGVAAVLVTGAQRFQAALLIEPIVADKELSTTERAAFIESIWPTIEEANQVCPAHARIVKSHILFTQPQKPMLRAGKGTVQRAGTLKLYEKEIDALYDEARIVSAEDSGADFRDSISVNDIHLVSKFVKESISCATKWQDFDDADNFFMLGLDSLQALMAVRRLKQGLKIPNLALSTIYMNPSISMLTDAILNLSKQHQVLQTYNEQARYQVRSDMLEEYQEQIDRMTITSMITKQAPGHSIILTGSTGALGSYILDALLAIPEVTHVYCLNRGSDSHSLHTERNQARGLPSEFDSARVTFLTADLSKAQLGLQHERYTKLLKVASLVIHNAWPVNFNLSLSSFRPQLDGIINLINFTATAALSPRLFFISSISSVLSYRTTSLRTPEEIVVADSAPSPNGYAESKYLSEQLLHYAARKLSIEASIARVGQIAGAVKHVGLWNRVEWFPSLVISSFNLGAVPDSLGSSLGKIDWAPIDLLADILVELALGTDQQPQQNGSSSSQADTDPLPRRFHIFHPLNPVHTTWDAVRPVVTTELSSLRGKSLEVIPLRSWIDRVRQDSEFRAGTHVALADGALEAYLLVNPAVKLLGFYESLCREEGRANELETEKTERRSSKLRALEGGIKSEWVRKWVREWIAA
ncbi:MAG: hypothetical protein Q9187_005810 [Circinaria calcarea]